MVNHKSLIVLILALLVAPFSFAGIETLFDRHGFAIYPAANGVSATTNATINATAANGSRAVVPTGVAVQVGKSTIAANAVRIARAGSAIGVAWTAWETYNAIKDSGITVCPAPDFFCKPGATTETGAPIAEGYSYRWYGESVGSAEGDPLTLCQAKYPPNAAAGYPLPSQIFKNPDYAVTKVVDCWRMATSNTGAGMGSLSRISTTCQSGYTMTNGVCKAGTTAPTPYTDSEFEQAITFAEWDAARSKRMWDAVSKDAAKIPTAISFKDQLGGNSPVSVTGSPVTLPEVTTKVRTYPNPDGTTSTEVEKQKTTFTPTKEGSTVNDANVTAKETTVTTNTVTNNTTNNVTTNTTTTTPVAPAGNAEPPPTDDLCKTNPDIVACKKLGSPLEATEVADKKTPLSITQDSGWGMSDAGCPAPGSITAMGKTIPVPWDMFCQFAHGIRPFLIAFAYMAAIGGFLGLSRKD
jgi:hypothetical protein